MNNQRTTEQSGIAKTPACNKSWNLFPARNFQDNWKQKLLKKCWNLRGPNFGSLLAFVVEWAVIYTLRGVLYGFYSWFLDKMTGIDEFDDSAFRDLRFVFRWRGKTYWVMSYGMLFLEMKNCSLFLAVKWTCSLERLIIGSFCTRLIEGKVLFLPEEIDIGSRCEEVDVRK